MHGAMRSMSISTGHALSGGSGTSKELSNSMGYLMSAYFCHCERSEGIALHLRMRLRVGIASACTQVGLARLAHIWSPISGKPEIGACLAMTSTLPGRDQRQNLLRRQRRLGD